MTHSLPGKFKLPGKERLSPNYSRKISDIILELAQEIAPVDSESGVFASAVGLAVGLWNTSLLPEADQAEAMNRIRQWLAERGGLDLQMEVV